MRTEKTEKTERTEKTETQSQRLLHKTESEGSESAAQEYAAAQGLGQNCSVGVCSKRSCVCLQNAPQADETEAFWIYVRSVFKAPEQTETETETDTETETADGHADADGDTETGDYVTNQVRRVKITWHKNTLQLRAAIRTAVFV